MLYRIAAERWFRASAVFGFWPDGPYVVAVASAQEPDGSKNWFSGGSYLTHLVTSARADYP